MTKGVLLLGEAEVGGSETHTPSQESGKSVLDMVSLKCDPHSRLGDLHGGHVRERWQIGDPGRASRTRHLSEQMIPAIGSASHRRLAESAAFLDVPAGAELPTVIARPLSLLPTGPGGISIANIQHHS